MSRTFALLVAASLLAAPHGSAHAQAVEAVPLSQPSYTLNKETDPMAMDPSGVVPEKTVNRGETQIAPPPPGADDQAGTSTQDIAPASTAPAETTAAPALSTTSANTNAAAPQNFPNNSVSGVLPSDERKFENRTFCTLKVSFTAKGRGIDSKTADKVKSYLDSNAEKLTYIRAPFGKKGEYEYCIDIPQHNARSKIYAGLKRLLPPKDSGDTRTILTGKGFTRVQNSM